MKIARLAAAAALLGTAVAAAPAAAQDYTFRLAHYLPPMHNHAANVLPEWVERIEAQSQGRIAIELFPAGQLLGINDIFDGVRSGVAELGWGLPAANANRFRRLSLIELPFQFSSAVEATRTAMTLYEEGLLGDEFDGFQLLYIHTHGAAGIHTREIRVEEPADLQGLRIRFPSPTVREMLAAYGAEPVGVPAPQVYESLETGTLDGVAFPYEAMSGLRLGEQVTYHTEIPLYTLTFYLVMNQQVFDSLPEDLQQVLLDNSGMDEALAVAASWDEEEIVGKAFSIDQGGEIIEVPREDYAAWVETAQPAIDGYIDRLESEGIAAREIHDRILELTSGGD